MVRIITDSTADLSPELVARHKVQVIPLAVSIGDEVFTDGPELPPQRLFELVRSTGQMPKTAAPAVGEFIRAFQGPGEPLYIGLSNKLSATFQNARLAAAEVGPGRVRIVDSLNLSTGIGLLVLRAADLRDQGLSAAEIEQAIQSAVPLVRTSFVVETMEYLYKGGRCTALQSVMGSLLKIRPVIEVRPDGTIGVKEKTRGTRKKALDSMLLDLQKHLPELDRRRVFVTHSGCDEDAEFLKQEITRLAAPDEVLVTTAGAVISSHCGPDTIGILYCAKEGKGGGQSMW